MVMIRDDLSRREHSHVHKDVFQDVREHAVKHRTKNATKQCPHVSEVTTLGVLQEQKDLGGSRAKIWTV